MTRSEAVLGRVDMSPDEGLVGLDLGIDFGDLIFTHEEL